MNRDDIVPLYLQVSAELCDGKEWCLFGVAEPLQRFAELVAEAAKREADKAWRSHAVALVQDARKDAEEREREACARLAYAYPSPDPGGSWRESIGAAIRARGQR